MPKKKAQLVSAFNVLNNNYQFEIKKVNMFDTNELNLNEKKEKVKKEKNEENKNINSRSISYGKRIRKKILVEMKKKKNRKPEYFCKSS